MKRLKCWKKLNDDMWIKKSTTNIFRGEPGTDKVGIVERDFKTDAIIMESGKYVRYKEFKTKPKALSFIKKFMEEHDSC